MTSGSIQLKEPIPTNSELIGSFYTGAHPAVQEQVAPQTVCPACNELLIPESKYCGDCGSPTGNHAHAAQPSHVHAAHSNNMPAFAQVSPQLRKPIPPALKKEYTKVSTLLIRERFFLVMHCTIYAVANLFGLCLAFKAYTGFFADEMTRVMISVIPLFFINTVSLGCLVPIKGTRKEIARLKNRMTYLHFQIEYVNLS